MGVELMDVVVAVAAAGLLGLLVGSFANVPIHRWPRDGSVTRPSRSYCPACETELTALDNVPVVSWLALRGRCRHCSEPIHWRYPTVEAVTALLFGYTTYIFGVSWLLPALLVLMWSLVVATAIDLEHRIIPNKLTYRLPFVLLALLLLPTFLGPGDLGALRRGVITGFAVPFGFFAVAELYRLVRGRTGFGMGDVKLLLSLGLVCGYLGGFEILVLLYGSMFSGVIVALLLMVSGRAKLASKIPFGPYLAIGTLIAVFWADRLRGPVVALLGV